jgi:hypothetical protein
MAEEILQEKMFLQNYCNNAKLVLRELSEQNGFWKTKCCSAEWRGAIVWAEFSTLS